MDLRSKHAARHDWSWKHIAVEDALPLSSTSSSAMASIFRTSSSSNEAVLVTAPRASGERDAGAVLVELETCATVDLSSTNTVNPLRRFLETNFGVQKPVEQEMEEIANAPVKIPSPQHLRATVDSYDICREYSYEQDDDDDDDNKELHNHYFNNASNSEAVHSITSDDDDAPTTFLLGKRYHPVHDYSQRRADESSLFWFTYRCDFPTIEPYGITSDAGWGCMLRALQMLMGQALKLHYKSRDWKPPTSLSNRRADPFLRSLLTWFSDFPSRRDSVYSLHNMVAAGIAKYDKLPGEWYGPGTACYVLKDLAELHERHDSRMFRVHVASGGTVYRNVVQNKMAKESLSLLHVQKQKVLESKPPAAHPLDVSWEEELLVDPLQEAEWDTAMLLLIPLRLGLKSFNAEYSTAIAHVFSLPQSVGVLGGRPRGARWFYGALSDGSKIFGLDPHTVQAAPRRREAQVNETLSSVVELSDEYLRSVHTTHPEVFSIPRIDPTIALGFYCRDRADFERVVMSLAEFKRAHPDVPELFTVADLAPNYDDGVNNVSMSHVLNMVDSMSDDDDGGCVANNDESEEDEYIML